MITLKDKGSGIYMITHQGSGNRYIGSASSLRTRIARHLHGLQTGTHHNPHMQAAFLKYGVEAFRVEVLEHCPDKKNLVTIEQFWIDKHNPEYNVARIAGNTLGVKHSAEVKQGLRLSALARVKNNPEGHQAKTLKANQRSRELWATPEYRASREAVHLKMAEKTSKVVSFNGVTKRVSEWAADLGINRGTLLTRLQRWTVEEALSTPCHGRTKESCVMRTKRQGKLLGYRGEFITCTELCRRLGTSRASWNGYIKTHSAAEAITFFERGGRKGRTRLFAYDGEDLSVSEISRRSGVAFQTLYRRVIEQGMPMEEALITDLKTVYHDRAVKGWLIRARSAL